MDREALLTGLDEGQRRAVSTAEHPLCILAGAGSGKTRVLTRRIAHRVATGDADARRVLALTFTRKAAAELSSRLRALGLRDLPTTGTFHAVAWSQLQSYWKGAGRVPPELLDRKARILGPILGSTSRMSVAELGAEIEWAKARLVDTERYAVAAARADRRTGLPPAKVGYLYAAYEDQKRRRGLVDFDDLLQQCADALEQDRAFADAQRWRFRHLFVDEFQDVNSLQHRLLSTWLGDRDDLCVVGDPHQAIYGWNGADSSYLADFDRHIPGAVTLRLGTNYRSTAHVLAAAEAVLPGATPKAPSSSPLSDGAESGPPPTVRGFPSDDLEAR
ncbi:MAG: ATP-dependent helicase, partial [Acidimicrobiales bacterium]